VDDRFRARRLKRLKIFSPCYPALGTRSQSSSNSGDVMRCPLVFIQAFDETLYY
jgi:hypothetical protein